MENPAGVGEVPQSLDLRDVVRRSHAVIHIALALLLVGAMGLPLGPRLLMAAVSIGAFLVPRFGPSMPWIGRTELVAVTNVVAGFIAFSLVPEVPALSLILALVGLVAAALIARPLVERATVALALALEVAKLPIVAGSNFESSLPFLRDVLRHPLDVLVGSIVQSIGLFAIYGVVHLAARLLRRTQRALVASEARYRMLTEALPNAVLVVSEGRVAFANRAAQGLLGDVAISVQGHFLDEVLSDDLLPGLKDAIRGVREGGGPLEIEGTAMGDASHAIQLSATVSALEYEHNPAVMVVVRDVSERFAAEQGRREGEARFRAAFLHTATPFVLLTPDGKVLDLNDAAVRLFQLGHGDAVGERWERFVEARNVDEFKEFVGASTVGMVNHLRTEAMLIPSQGNAVRAEIDVTVDRTIDGSLRNYIVQIHDVTARHEAEQALRLNEQRYRSLFERSPVALYRTRPDGAIVDVNRALIELMGYASRDEMLARRAEEIYVDRDERMRIRQNLERDGEVRGRESQVFRADGSVIWVRDTSRLVEQDGTSFFEGSLVDVTARRRADSLLRRAAIQGETVAKLGQFALATVAVDDLFAEAVKNVVSVLDVTTAAVALPAASGSFETVAAVGWADADSTVLRSRLEALMGFAAAASRPIVVTPRVDGDDRVEESAVAIAIRGADRVLGVIVAMDRSGRTFSPDGLHFLRSVANVLAAAIDRHESRTQLEQIVRSKDEFIASISHELRTPLTVVAGMAHELQDQWQEFSSGEIEELISLMVDQSSDMRNLIEDLLVAARADIGKVPVHMVAMEVAPAIDAVLAAFPERNGSVIRADLAPVTAVADPTRVRQIVRNLLTNAMRYGGSTITVSSGVRADEAYVRVHDDGPGIAENQHEQIFEPYESVHVAVGTPGSVGLGLTISRKLARLMGGDLVYRVADGSVFELILPLAADARNEADDVGVQATETPLSWSSLLS